MLAHMNPTDNIEWLTFGPTSTDDFVQIALASLARYIEDGG